MVLNGLLFLSSVLTIGTRYMGTGMVLVAFISCLHVAALGMVLGNHIVSSSSLHNEYGGIMSNGLLHQTTAFLRQTSARYGANSFAYGSLFGASCILIILMHFASSYFGGLATCVANHYSHTANRGVSSAYQHNVTGGYGSHEHDHSSSALFHPYSTCGASGPTGFVSFLTGILAWLNFALAWVLYTKRGALMGDSQSYQYDEIGGNNSSDEGFAGDFPLNGEGRGDVATSGGVRTMHV